MEIWVVEWFCSDSNDYEFEALYSNPFNFIESLKAKEITFRIADNEYYVTTQSPYNQYRIHKPGIKDQHV